MWIRRLAVASLVMLAGVACRGIGDGLSYRPDSRVHGTPAGYGVEVEEVSFAAPGGPRLSGWWIPGRDPARGTVVYCHGNHANLTHHARFVTWLPRELFAAASEPKCLYVVEGGGHRTPWTQQGTRFALRGSDRVLQRGARAVTAANHPGQRGAVQIASRARRVARRCSGSRLSSARGTS